MYTPHHIEWLDRTESHSNGWPKFVTPEAQAWATERVKEIIARSPRPLPTYLISDVLFSWKEIPECLRNISLYDARHGITHRALLAADMQQTWAPERLSPREILSALQAKMQERGDEAAAEHVRLALDVLNDHLY
jgi:hypothetical protein